MPRGGWKKPVSERRLSDLVSVGVLTRVFPPALVDEVIAGVGRTEQRHRSLPARVMAYFAIGMALYSEGSYEDVLAQLTDGLSWALGWTETFRPPSKSAIFQARARLGAEPLAALFERVARPVGTATTPGVWLAGRRLVAIDGMCLDVADTSANHEYFGRPGVDKGEQAAFPQARVVALAECGTHAVFAAEIGTYPESEAALAERLLDRMVPGMVPGMVLTADRGFFSYALWRKAIATGADLLWRIRTDKSGPKPIHLEDLPDGSWLAHLRQTHTAAARREEPMLVRVIDYTIDDGRDNPTAYRLFTTLTDPDEVNATDLAAAYAQRWEIELTFDELKTHQRGPRTVLRSKSPDLVLQEIWGHLCCHYAIRSLMAETATHSGHDPDRVSFVAALRITRQTLAHPGAFSP
ncbi:DDE family transposase [Kribbella sp. VKM Ac-2571]|uniref:IS4 family transposase n=1 Tax=Kribbella sp. VKM Ac-2571 TaxID=2512222 RepID=UPI00105B836B|nr:IS4 family transposase [Kribbella sp. VKM Ac-2571]TDO56651.1 DDE family transposase [Kribbella sp. VKM Ac-2571]